MFHCLIFMVFLVYWHPRSAVCHVLLRARLMNLDQVLELLWGTLRHYRCLLIAPIRDILSRFICADRGTVVIWLLFHFELQVHRSLIVTLIVLGDNGAFVHQSLIVILIL